jgi:hypothetical protein
MQERDHNAMSNPETRKISHHELERNERNERPRKRTPLPKFQLFIVFLIQFAEPVTASVIYPFINQLVRETGVTGGDERKTGYFAGIIVSVFLQSYIYTILTKALLGVSVLYCRSGVCLSLGLDVRSLRS